MQIDFTTPALLLPAISLVLLAHTQRFLGLASVIRGLHDKLRHQPSPALAEQIASLTRRVMLVRNMQFLGVAGLLASVLAMLAIFAARPALGQTSIGIALVLLAASLALSLRDIQLSVHALRLELGSVDGGSNPPLIPTTGDDAARGAPSPGAG
jgi:hypothetical protein